MYTPWGRSDSEHKVADGITFYGTPSHGGYHLSMKRWNELVSMFPRFRSFTGAQWLEEDCDASMPALVWPDLFTPQNIYNSMRSAQSRSDKCITWEWKQSAHGQKVQKIAAEYQATIAEQWEIGSMGSCGSEYPDSAWGVSLSRNGQRKAVIFKDYPEKQFYTDAELAELTIPSKKEAAHA